MEMYSYEHVLTGAGIDVGVMVQVEVQTVPETWLRVVQAIDQRDLRSWTEVGMPDRPGCEFGCKLYARSGRDGQPRFAVYHSRTYGHGSSPVTIARRRLVTA